MLPLRPSWAVPPCAQFPLVLEDGAGPLYYLRLLGATQPGPRKTLGESQYANYDSISIKLARDRVPSRSFLGGTSEGKSLDERRCEGGKRADRDGGSPVAGLNVSTLP